MIKFLVNVNDKNYDISQLVIKVSYQDTLNNGCSVLSFTYIDDNLVIKNGSVVSFTYNSDKIFYGYVFKVKRDKGKEISVTAYDQLRYCKAKDTIVIKGDTVTSLTKKMCNYFELKKGTLTETGYKLSTDVKDDTTWLDIIYSGISETKKNKNKRYLLRDEFGSICIRSLDELKLDLILGDKSLVYDYSYVKSIDDETYNKIKIHLADKSDGENQFVIKKDDKSIAKFGLLQYYESVYNTNASKAKEEAESLFKQYNKEGETLQLSCLGDTRIRAGVSFYGKIKDINYDKRIVVKSVTHDFLPVHTMNVEANYDQ